MNVKINKNDSKDVHLGNYILENTTSKTQT